MVASSRTSAKRDFLLDQGADAVIAIEEQAFAPALLAATGGRGADLVLDGIGGGFIAEYVEALAMNGVAYIYGGLSGTNDVAFPILPLVQKRAGVVGYSLINEVRDADRLRRGVEWVLARIDDGTFGRPVIDSVFDLSEAGEAYARMRSGAQRGKIIVQVSDQPSQ
ncbi:zinc-binding dehydrogenase [Nonomuraea sp. NPDC050536]|uniref:zinc-binding dehydrogenase n=1 Tax=Nonomuraea sp. NPDC050536 TaxID=3364366 RepID=UPI0037CB1825